MRLLKLDNRLSLCASFVRPHAKLCDVGTDHAFLPVFLAYSGIVDSCIATDINKGPLESGQTCVNKYNLNDKIELRLCNGLESVKEDEVDDIVIAGMGGELIIDILSKCDFINKKNLILQPMTKYNLVIEWLYKNGFDIDKQKACESDGKYYTVILASYKGSQKEYSDEDSYLGNLDMTDQDSKMFIKSQIKHLNNKLNSEPSLSSLIKKLSEEI